MTRLRLRRTAVVLAAVIMAQLGVFALVWSDSQDRRIRDVPVAITAPAIVADSIAQEAHRLPGRPFKPRFARTPAAAEKMVADGVVVAALAVDLTSSTDTLYVATAHGDTLVDAVVDDVRGIESRRGRFVDVSDVVPARPGDRDLGVTRALVLIWLVIGFFASATVAFVKGTRPPSRRTGLVRLFAMAALSIAVGFLGALLTASTYDGHVLPVWGIGALTVFTAGAATMALQSFFGMAGLGIAAVLFLMLDVPDIIANHSLLLPEPWPSIDPWVPHGAATSAIVSIVSFGAYTVVKPVLVLGTWGILAVAITVLVRRERARA